MDTKYYSNYHNLKLHTICRSAVIDLQWLLIPCAPGAENLENTLNY